MEKNWKEDIIQNKLGGKRDWTEAERMELCHQLDKDINLRLNSVTEGKPLEDGWREDNWKEKMAEHPIFSPFLQDGQTQAEAPLNELSEGLAQLKFDPAHNTPLEVAQNYKEDGIHHFKYKKYRLAILSFTEGIKANCADKELNAQLYNNRAAAHFFLKNYRSALKDCHKASELKPDYLKPIARAIQCGSILKSWNEVIEWCDKGLHIQSFNEDFIKQRSIALKEKKINERDSRRNTKESRKKQENVSKLVNAIIERGIHVESSAADNDDDVSPGEAKLDLEPHHPAAKESPVHLNSEGELVWPVVFLYPEFNESDSILEFNENSRFYDHLETMFGPDAPQAPWDRDSVYQAQNLAIYFEDRSNKRLVTFSPNSTLKEVLSNSRYTVRGGTPCFIILVENSVFLKSFVSTYKK